MTAQAHNLVAASCVKGALVYNSAGESIGHIQDLSIDKASGQVVYALVSFGGFLGVGDRFHPVPWSILHYDVPMDGYIVPLDRAAIAAAPSYTHEELTEFGANKNNRLSRMLEYYDKHPPAPIR